MLFAVCIHIDIHIRNFMKKIVDTERKYRPTSLNEFVFPNAQVEEIVRAYGSGYVTRPLILSGQNGTGKSLLSELIPTAIEVFKPQVNRVKSCDLNSSNDIRQGKMSDKTAPFNLLVVLAPGQWFYVLLATEGSTSSTIVLASSGIKRGSCRCSVSTSAAISQCNLT
jgi:hypothetical protein